jgi:hypothetical protein
MAPIRFGADTSGLTKGQGKVCFELANLHKLISSYQPAVDRCLATVHARRNAATAHLRTRPELA